jgi:microcystin-dependent protein
MAGSIALSLTQRYDKTSHEPLDGGLLYFYAAGTTTPQSAYQDVSLTIPWPNPITLDSGGNVPQLFFDDGYVKFRLSNAAGVTQIEADFVLVLGPTSGVGAAPSVDATTIMATGDIKVRYGTGVLTGFVRANGRTIGSATSGASEYANSAAQTLFEYLWTEDANLTVSTGRGASAAADWAANKTIALPDFRGRVIAALDDMGNSAAGRRTTTYTGVAATVLGSVSTHGESHTLTAGESAVLVYSVTQGTYKTATNKSSQYNNGSQTPAWNSGDTDATTTGIAVSTNAGGNPHSVVDPTIFITTYMKL